MKNKNALVGEICLALSLTDQGLTREQAVDGTEKGWQSLIESVCDVIDLVNADRPDDKKVRIIQVKEKCGGLRFYTDREDLDVDGAIRSAEGRSYLTCETCGAPGTLWTDGWWKTLCDFCHKTR